MANISIKEGGTAKQFGHVNKLKISNQGGGTSLWVPEDAVKTKNLYVTKNGTYYANKDEDKPYGYDEVSVNITDEAYGYDDDGNLWDVGVDDDDFLEEEELPTEIKVVTPPDKLEYVVGEPIDPKGMVVIAYNGDGSEWGELSFGEYLLDPPIALNDGETKKSATSDLETDPPQPIYFGDTMVIKTHSGSGSSAITTTETFTGATFVLMLYDGYRWIAVSTSEDGTYTQRVLRAYDTGGVISDDTYTDDFGHSYTNDGKTVYYDQGGRTTIKNREFIQPPTNTVNHSPTYSRVAWTVIYGDITIESGSTIDVNWEREDGEILSDSFFVDVRDMPVPNIGGDDSGGGGSSGGSW